MVSSLRRNATDILAVILAACVLAAFMAKHSSFFHDDAYITLRYACNFAETGLIQWNQGEWVEGYTSLLHVILTGGLIWAGLPAVTAAQLVNGTAALALLAFTAVAACRIAPAQELRAARALTILIVAATPSLAIWVLGGLESVLVAALLTGGLAALLAYLERPSRWCLALAALAFSCAVLTRLDASVFIAGAGLGVLLAGPCTRSERLRVSAVVVGVPAFVAFAQMGVRLQVYGEIFPLTFYAKTDLPATDRLSSGVPYVMRSMLIVPVLAFAAVATLPALALHRLRSTALLIFCAVLLPLCYVVWAGGDHMPAARMLVPLVAPITLLLLALSIGMAPIMLTALVSAAALVTFVQSLAQPPRLTDPAAFAGKIVGRHIEMNWPAGITIAVNTAGSTPFYAGDDRIFIDMLGLNDSIIAKRENVPVLVQGQRLPGHRKGDGAYILSRVPDRIIIGPAEGVDISTPWFLSGFELGQSPEFAECYRKVVEKIPYSNQVARRGPPRPNPLTLTYYDRVCP